MSKLILAILIIFFDQAAAPAKLAPTCLIKTMTRDESNVKEQFF